MYKFRFAVYEAAVLIRAMHDIGIDTEVLAAVVSEKKLDEEESKAVAAALELEQLGVAGSLIEAFKILSRATAG